ncbi:hypothetical protein AIOL_003490 [Candidatus Rhodobacter oscarellae]|uniref:Exostosin GT47 domain-containing protein n=1 Tax=Candidatus Rhodobacter oscarellae TaxID=1675527 RepID=A0A0J9EA08_9RHOB|nr:hypothetical protein AIOL_003490 [Candidatus Rhodobacter lobularis]
MGSKGLMKLCETRQPGPNDVAERWSPWALRAHRPGGRIYVHAPALAHFARWSLPLIRKPFVLVSGDAVLDVSPDALGPRRMRRILEHPHLIRWHAQNCGHDHPKLAPMPLGLDYHTIGRNRRPEWGPQASPLAQEAELHRVRERAAALERRDPRAYSNWHFVLGNGDRAEVIKQLPPEATEYQPARQPRLATWQRNAAFAFTISPRGRGMDCHRTWEGILLGAIPVIPDLPINRLFADLPVVIVQDWRRVTPGFLAEQRARILSQSFDFAPVLLETWRRRLFGLPDLPPLRMGYAEFMALGPEALRAHAMR